MTGRGVGKAMAAVVWAGVALLVAGAAAPRAEAAIQCGAQDAWGQQTCVVGIRSEVAQTFARASGPQAASQWCWAASIEMVFRHHGFHVDQRRIVRETYGREVDLPSSGQTILQNLNRVWVDDSGRRFRVQADVSTASPATAAQDLMDDQPLIIGTQGHAMVLTALTYQRDGWGNGAVSEAVVRDPWPGRGRRSLRADEWYGVMFLARIRVTPLDR